MNVSLTSAIEQKITYCTSRNCVIVWLLYLYNSNIIFSLKQEAHREIKINHQSPHILPSIGVIFVSSDVLIRKHALFALVDYKPF